MRNILEELHAAEDADDAAELGLGPVRATSATGEAAWMTESVFAMAREYFNRHGLTKQQSLVALAGIAVFALISLALAETREGKP